eukprot:scaffold3356_cov154-Skeletonema_menzelii.AAC.15
MNLINSFNLLSSVSPDVARTARMLAPPQSNRNLRHDMVIRGNAACNFKLSDAFLFDERNIETFTYAPGEACSFGVTTIAYVTSPVTHNIVKGANSNTFELSTCYHLAVMKTDDEDGNAWCYENAFVKTSSTQYMDGSASFVITGGEIPIYSDDIREWTNVDVNGADGLEAPGFFYIDEGYAGGEVIFGSSFKATANYTHLEGKYVDLCQAMEDLDATSAPTPSAVFEDVDDAAEMGNVVCDFNGDINAAEVHRYEAGEACPFAVTTVSYMTSPESEHITNGVNSNTYEHTAYYNLAAMRDYDGTAHCISNAYMKTSSTQYRGGSASFSGTGGEHVLTSDAIIGDWTSIKVNGGDSVNGFYYMADGIIEGDVVFKGAFDYDANFTKIEGTFINLCEAIEDATPTPAPTPSSGFDKNICPSGQR